MAQVLPTVWSQQIGVEMTSAPKQALAQHCQEQLASLRALADELEADDWEAPSLCTGWDVKTLGRHGRAVHKTRSAPAAGRTGGPRKRRPHRPC